MSNSLNDQELLDHLTLMRDDVAREIGSLQKRIPQYRADFEQDGYQETLAMIHRLEVRLTRRKTDFEALTQSLRLVENQMP